MIDQNQGIVIFISTPRGKNHFYDIFETAKRSPGWFAEQRGVAETDIFDNGQLAETLDELVKVYGKAQGEAFFDAEYGASFTEEMENIVPFKQPTRAEAKMARKLNAISLIISRSAQMWEEGRMPDDVRDAHKAYWSGELD
jgi:hypothetical protein